MVDLVSIGVEAIAIVVSPLVKRVRRTTSARDPLDVTFTTTVDPDDWWRVAFASHVSLANLKEMDGGALNSVDLYGAMRTHGAIDLHKSLVRVRLKGKAHAGLEIVNIFARIVREYPAR